MPVRNFIAAATVLIAAGAALSGQESATLTLKSDARLGGQLIDLNASAFTIRVDGQERQIAKGDVAVIEFGGDGAAAVPSEATNMQPGQHLVQLRSGQVVAGEFVDIGGTQPLRLSFLTATGPREFSSSEVRRIYLTKPVAAAAAAAAAPAQQSTAANEKVVTVSSRQAWTDTGIRVRRGETLVFDATGEIVFDTSGAKATPGRNSNGTFDSKMPVPTAPTATLIGRIAPAGATARMNTAGAFAVGDQKSVVMPGDGVLFLGINDTGFADNRGEWQVRIGTGGLQN